MFGMRSRICAILFTCITVYLTGNTAIADHRQPVIIADPNDSQWLHAYVKEKGHMNTIWGGQWAERTFSTNFPPGNEPYPIWCRDVKIEVNVSERHFSSLFVFDSLCHLPIRISTGEIRVSGKVRLVIDAKTGALELGSTPWITEHNKSKFVENEIFIALIRKTFEEIVRDQKKFLERFPNAK